MDSSTQPTTALARRQVKADGVTDPDLRLYRMPAVIQLTGLARSTIYKVMSLGRFPKQVHLTDQSVAWRGSDIDAWIASRSTRAGKL